MSSVKPNRQKLLSWVVVLLFVIPTVTHIGLHWRLYFDRDMHRLFLLLGFCISVPLTLVSYFKLSKAKAYEGAPSKAKHFSSVQWLFAPLGVTLLLYGWFLLIFALQLILPVYPLQERVFTIGELRETSYVKNQGCSYRVSPQSFLGADPSESSVELCAPAEHWDTFQSTRVVRVLGYFSDHLIFVREVKP